MSRETKRQKLNESSGAEHVAGSLDSLHTSDSRGDDSSRFMGRVAVVCASNQNRSMAAHKLLCDHGYSKNVWSYGTGTAVRMPGPTPHQPNIFQFGTPYKTMFDDLQRKDTELYTRNGLLKMLQRNLTVKVAPERWQLEQKRQFDLVICYETRVYDAVVQDLSERKIVFYKPVHVVGMHVKDNHVEAERGAQDTILFLTELAKHEDWEQELESVLVQVSKRTALNAKSVHRMQEAVEAHLNLALSSLQVCDENRKRFVIQLIGKLFDEAACSSRDLLSALLMAAERLGVDCVDFSFQEALVQRIFNSRKKEFPAPRKFARSFAKFYLNHVEQSSAEEISDGLIHYSLPKSTSLSNEMERASSAFRIYHFHHPLEANAVADDQLVLAVPADDFIFSNTGLMQWDAGVVLAEYLFEHREHLSKSHQSVLELGSGLGLAGLTVAKFFSSSHCYLSDGNLEVVANLSANCALNCPASASTLHIDWSNPWLAGDDDEEPPPDLLDAGLISSTAPWSSSPEPGTIDFIIAADVLYDPVLIPVFLAALRRLLSIFSCPCLIAQTHRSEETTALMHKQFEENRLIARPADSTSKRFFFSQFRSRVRLLQVERIKK